MPGGIFTGQVSQRFENDRLATISFIANDAAELNARFEKAEKAIQQAMKRHNDRVIDAGENLRERVTTMRADIERAYAKRLIDAGLLPRDFLPEVNGADAPTGPADTRADS